MIELAKKKSFINWVTQSVTLKKREAYWVLNYFLNHEMMLNKVVFVEDISQVTRGLRMTDHYFEGSGMLMVKDNLLFEDPEQIFHEIRTNRKEILYLEINVVGVEFQVKYQSIIEQNPFRTMKDSISDTTLAELEEFLVNASFDYEKQALEKEIDLAIEGQDVELFNALSHEYKQLEKQK